jgi:cytochrome P450
MHQEFSFAGTAPYRPPAPIPQQMLSLFRGELLSMLPAASYEQKTVSVRKGKRPVVLINDPDLIRLILGEKAELLIKSDVTVAALRHVVGSGLLVSTGELWRRQRAMLEPALARLRMRLLFPNIVAALDEFVRRLRCVNEVSLEREINMLVFDVIARSVFSSSLGATASAEMFEELSRSQELLPQLGPLTLFGFAEGNENLEELKQRTSRLRGRIGALIDKRLSDGPEGKTTDILQAVLDARSAEGIGFTREELIDHIAVFVFAGYDTTASALTWALFILSQQPELAAALRREARQVAADRALGHSNIAALSLARMVFLETLRLYPSVTFLSRTALEKVVLGEMVVEKGSLVVISPWIVHRHRLLWNSPELFIPERFSREAEREIPSGAFIPFGFGPRMCPGRSLAMMEGPYLIAGILRQFGLEVSNAREVMPVARVTIRPNTQIDCRFYEVN